MSESRNRGRARREFLRRRRSGDMSWIMMELALSMRCNLHCTHCSAAKFRHATGKSELTIDEARDIINQAADAGFITICFVGGEPTVYPHLEQVTAHAADRGLLPSIITNGLRLDESIIRRLADAGLDTLCVSLNGADASLHDQFVRQPGAFDQTFEHLQLALSLGIETAVSVVPFRSVVDSGAFRRLVEFIREHGCKLNINYPAVVGDYDHALDELLTPDQIAEVRRLHHQTRSWSDFMMTGEYACPAARNAVYVVPSGEVMACAFVHISFGNLFKDSLDAILHRMRENEFFQRHKTWCLAGEDRAFVERCVVPIHDKGLAFADIDTVDLPPGDAPLSAAASMSTPESCQRITRQANTQPAHEHQTIRK